MSTFPAVQIRHIARLQYGESLPSDTRRDGEVQVFGSNGPIGTHDTANTDAPVIVIGRKGSYGKLQFHERPVFAIDTTYFIDPSTSRHHLRWLFYAMSTAELDTLGQDVGVPGLNRDRAYTQLVPLPPFREQRTIAHFLDDVTTRIDALIAKKRTMIKLIGERRMATMAAGVSGGLSPRATRMESTLPWLESIPAHWDEVGLTLVAQLGSGHTPSRGRADWWVESECVIPWVTTGEVARLRSDRVEYIEETRERISPIGLDNSAAEVHPAGTVVLCRTASAGYSGIMHREMATSQDFATWTCGPLLRPRFLLLCFRAMRADLLGRLAMGSTHQTIYMPDIQSLRIPLPPVEEQDQIVDSVWAQMDSRNRAEDLLARQTNLLVERRQALIIAAVTGELDVVGHPAKAAS